MLYQMYKCKDTYKYKGAQCYIINRENAGPGHSHQSRFVFVKNNEIIAVANYMLVTNDVNPVPFTYYNLMDLAYDYNWFNRNTLAHIEGVGFDISYSSYSLCPMSRAHKEPEYFSFRRRVDFKRSTEYVGGIFVKDNRITRIIYPLGCGQKDIDVDLDFTENIINHIASVYFDIDHKIVICGYELPSEKQSKVNVSIDDQIFNAFMNRG